VYAINIETKLQQAEEIYQQI